MRIWDYEAAQRPDYIIANSRNVARRIKKYYRRKSTVIYPGTDLDKYRHPEFISGSNHKNNILNQVQNLPRTCFGDDNYYLIVSRLSKYKKVDLAIKACNKLKKKLVIIGDGLDKEYLKKIAGPTIEFKGFLPDKKVRDYYKNAKAFIFPAEEDFGLTPIEAMASGTPVIAYEKGGLLETVQEGLSGIFFKKQTVSGLCQAINKFEDIKNDFNPHRIRESVQKFDIINFREEFRKFVETKYNRFKEK
jgi:glycosyltransferase involved in cell wall biosynthesis